MVAKLVEPSNFITTPAEKTWPVGLTTAIVNIANGDDVVSPGATGRVLPLIVTVIVAVLVEGAVKAKVAGWKVIPLPAVIVAVPSIPALEPEPTNVTCTAPVVTVIVTLPHFTVKVSPALTERIATPPQTLMDAGVNPPVGLAVMRMPALGETSCMVSWHGVVGH